MDNRPIGVFDSGLGGLSVVRHLLTLLPGEDIVYFGDTGRVPYGTRSAATIEKYAAQDSRFLLSKNVKCIIAACGTVSSVAPRVLENVCVPAIGVVEPAADAAVAATQNRRIGVIGTAATIRSQAFQRRIQKHNSSLQVFSKSCPLFVPLVENGWIEPDDPVVQGVVKRYLLPLKQAQIDTLILGCTHFPLLAQAIAQEFDGKVKLIDAGATAAKACTAALTENDRYDSTHKQGACHFYVTDCPDGFSHVAAIFLGRPVQDDVTMVDIEEITNLWTCK